MNTKDWFSVAVRVVGLVCCIRGGEDFVFFLMAMLGYTSSAPSVLSSTSPIHPLTLAIGFFYFFAGLYLLRGAPLLLDYAFPFKQSEATVEQTKPDDTENQ